MSHADEQALVRLVWANRWAALATVDSRGVPAASMIAYAPEPGLASLVMHLSHLADHTRNLNSCPDVAVAISEPDSGSVDPQTLVRVSLQGTIRPVDAGESAYEILRGLYVARLPEAEARFQFTDFQLYRLVIQQAHYVGGFARTCTLDARRLQAVARASLS